MKTQSTLDLIRQLIDELSALFRHEVALVRAEIKESLQATTSGLLQVAIGAVILLIALLAAVAAAVLVLALIVPAWLAALAVAVVVAAVGYTIIRGGRRKLDASSLKPTRAPQSLRKDAAVLARRHHP